MFTSCFYDDDNNIVVIQYSSGKTISILCSLVEEELQTTATTLSKLDWLKDNEPSTYAELILNGTMQDFLNRIGKSHCELENNIKNQLSKTFDERTASMIAREFMMYDS